MKRIVVGVVGQIASGKGVFVEYLIKKFSFVSFSLSTIVHEELEKKNIKKFTRETMQSVGNGLRHEYGDDILAKRAVDLLKNQNRSRIVIEGIRNPGEIKFLKKDPSFVLVGIKAKRELRFKRLLVRAKPWDAKNRDDFVKIDNQDMGGGQKEFGQQVGKCLAYGDYFLTNNGTLEDFQKKIEILMEKILKASA